MFERIKETGQHTLIFGIGGMLQQGIHFALLPVYMRYLTPADYGVLNLLLIAGSFVKMIPSATVGPSLFRSYYDYETDKERSMVVSTALFLSITIAGVLLLIGVPLSRLLSVLLTGDSQYAMLTAIVLLNSTLMSANIVALAVFRAQKWSFRYMMVSLGALLVSLGTTIYLVVFQQLNIAGVIFGLLAGGVTSALLSLWMIRYHLRLAVSRLEIRKMVSYGLPFIPANIISFLQNSADRLIIQALLGPASVGLYALAKRFGQLIRILVINPFELISPAIVFDAERDPRAKEFYPRLLTYFLLVTAFIALGVAVLADDVLKLMADPEYWAAGAVVPWVCLAFVLYGARGLVSVGLALKRKTQWFPVSLAIGLVVYLSLMLALIPLFGILGVGISLAVAYLGVCIFRYWISQRVYSVNLEFRRIMKIAVATLILFWLGQSIGNLVMSTLASLMLSLLVISAGFPISLLLMKFPDAYETARIRQLRDLLKQKMKLILRARVD